LPRDLQRGEREAKSGSAKRKHGGDKETPVADELQFGKTPRGKIRIVHLLQTVFAYHERGQEIPDREQRVSKVQESIRNKDKQFDVRRKAMVLDRFKDNLNKNRNYKPTTTAGSGVHVPGAACGMLCLSDIYASQRHLLIAELKKRDQPYDGNEKMLDLKKAMKERKNTKDGKYFTPLTPEGKDLFDVLTAASGGDSADDPPDSTTGMLCLTKIYAIHRDILVAELKERGEPVEDEKSQGHDRLQVFQAPHGGRRHTVADRKLKLPRRPQTKNAMLTRND